MLRATLGERPTLIGMDYGLGATALAESLVLFLYSMPELASVAIITAVVAFGFGRYNRWKIGHDTHLNSRNHLS